jgi:hypothetical protein
MSFKRYTATADNSITNAYGIDGKTRATGSNTGQADVLEVFSNYGDVQTWRNGDCLEFLSNLT